MPYRDKTHELIKRINEIAKETGKFTGFSIGNTAKIDDDGLYFTPIRIVSHMVIGGVIVYSEKQAIDITKIVDGKVQYILVDAEKKIPAAMSLSGEPANVERAVRETIRESTLWIYKGNDLSVDAVDGLVMQLTKNSIRGVGGKRVAILGAGNLGCKLALKLVERGAHVFITRRDKEKLSVITRALNYIKPAYTTAEIVGTMDNEEAADGADIVIGMSQGIPLITSKMVRNLAPDAIMIDGGKGTLHPSAIKMANQLEIPIYRLDVSAAFEGLVSELWAIENIVEKRLGRRLFLGEPIVSGGLLGRQGEIVVDNVFRPKVVYGIANGQGDFIRSPSKKQMLKLKKIQKVVDGRFRRGRHA